MSQLGVFQRRPVSRLRYTQLRVWARPLTRTIPPGEGRCGQAVVVEQLLQHASFALCGALQAARSAGVSLLSITTKDPQLLGLRSLLHTPPPLEPLPGLQVLPRLNCLAPRDDRRGGHRVTAGLSVGSRAAVNGHYGTLNRCHKRLRRDDRPRAVHSAEIVFITSTRFAERARRVSAQNHRPCTLGVLSIDDGSL